MRIFRKKPIRSFAQVCIKNSIVLIALMGIAQQAVSQVIPKMDGTGTGVTLSDADGSTGVDITGGSQSSDGANLFHEFEQFDVNAGQSARFVTAPDVQNVLSLITGGASTIDGWLQVVGSQADLYLINPAGVLFGPNARLNLPGSLTVTTATRIGFEDRWLNFLEDSSGPADYSLLLGHPVAFDFSSGLADSGSVINLGDLTVGAGQSLSLMGSTVVSTGTLSASGGTITLSAVGEGRQLLRIDQSGRLLSLEVFPTAVTQDSEAAVEKWATPTLGELLTGGFVASADALVENADGTVSLVSTGTVVPENGETIVVSGQLSVAAETGM